ncbi:MCE family protein [Nocardia puris]|uniref:MlaD family protein n=1 Tax=Nocardia TaxID=1817 RepID=UPI0009DD5DBD|nr:MULTISPECIES: MlaD family protein [Nocardia]MBF6137180.1 MCE family protein [Nocardia otitidiscaviarum]MBF6181784.1 MCE family protein [Nocardia otitidiscaviarum]MBF6461676.1 MCE family protein [Nocardia puris]MBF6488078.1 MCE family protein [Nocardia otitidiscaviarum]
MSRYEMPGVSTTKRSSITVGALAILTVLIVGATWTILTENLARSDNRMQVVVRTDKIGDGINVGTPVQFDGVEIGAVTAIGSGGGAKQVTLMLDRANSAGLTDGLLVDYSPSNLFGISEVALKPGVGGAPLRDGAVIDLTGPRSDRQRDATMGVLIRTVAETSGNLLTPELTEVLVRVATTARQFTPLMEVIVVSGRNIAETQTMSVSDLLDQYGSMLVGSASMVDGTVGLIHRLTTIEILNNQRELFDATVSVVGQRFFPALAETLFTAQGYLSEYAVMLTPILSAASRMVSTPGVSSAQLSEILSRLDRSFTSTPEGTALNVRFVLDLIPGLTASLPGTFTSTPSGGSR